MADPDFLSQADICICGSVKERTSREDGIFLRCPGCGKEDYEGPELEEDEDGASRSRFQTTRIRQTKQSSKIQKVDSYEQRFLEMFLSQVTALVNMGYPERFFDEAPKIFLMYLKAMVPESFGANAKQAPEFEALQQTDDNEFLVLFSQHQEQEQSQLTQNFYETAKMTGVARRAPDTLLKKDSLCLLYLVAATQSLHIEMHVLVHMVSKNLIPYIDIDYSYMGVDLKVDTQDLLERSLKLAHMLGIEHIDRPNTVTRLKSILSDLSIDHSLIPPTLSLMASYPQERILKVDHEIPTLCAYLIITMKILFGFFDSDLIEPTKKKTEDLEIPEIGSKKHHSKKRSREQEIVVSNKKSKPDSHQENSQTPNPNPLVAWLSLDHRITSPKDWGSQIAFNRTFATGQEKSFDGQAILDFFTTATQKWKEAPKQPSIPTQNRLILGSAPSHLSQRAHWLRVYPSLRSENGLLRTDWAYHRLIEIFADYLSIKPKTIHRYVCIVEGDSISGIWNSEFENTPPKVNFDKET